MLYIDCTEANGVRMPGKIEFTILDNRLLTDNRRTVIRYQADRIAILEILGIAVNLIKIGLARK
jgi:hypothetical protein